MRFVDNGVPEDYARLTFEGLNVPLCELSQEEYMWVVYDIKDFKPNKYRGRKGLEEIKAKNKEFYDDYYIDFLDLSVRAEHCLQRADIKTIGELCGMTEHEVGRLRNMGAKSVKEVKEKLEKIGRKLRDNPVEEL